MSSKPWSKTKPKIRVTNYSHPNKTPIARPLPTGLPERPPRLPVRALLRRSSPHKPVGSPLACSSPSSSSPAGPHRRTTSLKTGLTPRRSPNFPSWPTPLAFVLASFLAACLPSSLQSDPHVGGNRFLGLGLPPPRRVLFAAAQAEQQGERGCPALVRLRRRGAAAALLRAAGPVAGWSGGRARRSSAG